MDHSHSTQRAEGEADLGKTNLIHLLEGNIVGESVGLKDPFPENRIPAAALFIVIVIALVIGIMCSTLILVGYYYKQEISDNSLLKKLGANIISGREWMHSSAQ